MEEPKFKVGDLVLYKGLLGRVKKVYNIGTFVKNFYNFVKFSTKIVEKVHKTIL